MYQQFAATGHRQFELPLIEAELLPDGTYPILNFHPISAHV